MAAAHAVASVRAISRACNSAAPSRPSAGISRVLARPAIGALARIATAIGSTFDIAVASGERGGVLAQEESQAQPPHRQHRAHEPMPLPAPAGGYDPPPQADSPSQPAEP